MNNTITINYIETENGRNTITETGQIVKINEDKYVTHMKSESQTQSIRFSSDSMDGKKLFREDRSKEEIKILYFKQWSSDYELHIVLPNEKFVRSNTSNYLINVNGFISDMVSINKEEFTICYNNSRLTLDWTGEWNIIERHNITEDNIRFYDGDRSINKILNIKSDRIFKGFSLE